MNRSITDLKKMSHFAKYLLTVHHFIQMNEDLKVISNRAYQWKILFNSDPNKQAIDVCFLQILYGDKAKLVPSQKV